MILIVFLLCFFSAFIIINKVCNELNLFLRLLLSIVLGLTVLSYTFSASLFFKVDFSIYQITLSVFLLFFILSNYKHVKNYSSFSKDKIKFSTQEILILLSSLLIFTLLFFNNSLRWGKWDAWAIWSLRSKFMISDYKFFNLFIDEIAWIHTDYPLMLPSFIASVWKSIGSTNPLVPLYTAFIIVMLVVLLLFTSLLHNNSKRIFAFLILITSIGTVQLDLYGSYQYADTLLSLFFLLPVLLFNLSKDNLNTSMSALVGFFAASSTWVKNEGIAFFILFLVFFTISQLKYKKHIIFFSLGSLLPLLFLVFFKTAYAPANDLVEGTNISSLDKLMDWDRYVLIFDYILNFILQKFPFAFILMIIVVIIDSKYCKTIGFKLISSLFLVYFFVYILTPLGLEWHLKTSIDRLFHQTSPLILFSIFYYFFTNYSIEISKTKIIN